ncbi:MAG: TIGR04552 family protein, partial [Myxococcales bacterium]|nr:TIGR04552 family protein [Myxococcales bacterium]
MRRDALELDGTPLSSPYRPPLSLGDVEAMRLLLAGGSVVDWHKAAFDTLDDVDQLLRLHLLEPGDPFDDARLRYLFTEAVAYVEEYLRLRVPPKVREVADVRELFLRASDVRGFRRTQVLSCMVLKLMHVMQHLEAADLRLRMPLSDNALLDLAARRIGAAADRMRADGVPLVAFYGSRKTRTSVITKLLCKRDDVATRVFDKLRYRVLVPEPEDLATALTWLVRHLVPFHMVVPGQSHNNLLDPDEITARLEPTLRDAIQPLVDDPVRSEARTNEFSGETYRMINVVVDLPVRLPDHALPAGPQVSQGRVVHVVVEFQLADVATDQANEAGENA